MMPSSLILYYISLSQDVLLVVFLATSTTTTPSYAFSSASHHVRSTHHSKWKLHRCRNRKNHDSVYCQSPCRSVFKRHGGAMYQHRWHTDTSFSFPLHQSIDNDNNNNNDATDGTARDVVENSTNLSDTNTKQDESGWVSNFGKYLLPPSWSLSLSRNSSPSSPPPVAAINPPTNVDVSTYDPNSREMADPIFLEGSTFSKASSVEGEAALAAAKMEECSVIDVECYVEEEEVPEDEEKEMASLSSDSEADVSNRLRGVVRRIRDRFKRNVAKEKEKSVLEDHSDVNVLSLPESNLQSAERIDLNESSNDTAPVADYEDPSNSAENPQEQSTTLDNPIPTQSATEGIPKRQKRSRRGHKTSTNHPPPIFHSLETNDIDTATQFKQKKWQRRRKRAAMLLTTLKNAAFLFVVTFLAGNVMNQFVDLTEDGSFEVHFGKSLSTTSPPSPLPSPPPQRSRLLQTGVEKRHSSNFRAMMKPSRTSPTTQYDARAETLGLVSRAVRRVGPAVVRVETETDVNTRNGDPSKGEVGDDEETRGDIFDGVPEAPSQGSSDDAKTIDFGQGSGMIIKREDEFHILTNAHVVDGATRVYVLLTDGRRFAAELCGKDDIVDVAVLKIIPEEDEEGVEGSESILDLPVAELGDSDRLEVGQFVTAIGSPGGLDNSCTIGIVSGLKRCPKVVGIPDKAGVLQYIQTDAAINQGNSGGPLVDVESGDIVGINTCIRANMEGTSFAIPINKVLGILDDLYEGKHISHGYLGVQMSTMNPTLARYYNKLQERSDMKIPEKDGVMIEKVFKKSPAEVGGLKKYDFVCEIDGQRVSNAEDAHLIIDQAPVGKDLCITLVRGDSEVTVQVKPEDLSVRLKQLREDRLKRKKVNT